MSSIELMAQQFEQACFDLNAINNDKRKEAEQIIQHYQNQPKPYDFCRYMLEYAKFYASNILKKAIIKEWTILDLSTKLSLSQYIFECVSSLVLGTSINITPESIQPKSVPQLIVNQLLQSYATIQKRSWIDEEHGGAKFKEMTFQHVQQLLSQGNLQNAQNLALQILLNLVTEFSVGGSTSEIGMNWEFHEKSRISFQKDFLSHCFELSVNILQSTLNLQNLFENVELLKMSVNALQLIHKVLSWDFSPFNEMSSLKSLISTKIYKNRLGNNESNIIGEKINPTSTEWRNRFTNTKILQLFIELHLKFRQGLVIISSSSNALDAELFIRITHLIRQCLTQWCNISNNCFEGDKTGKLNFLVGLLSSVFSLMSNSISTLNSREYAVVVGQEIYDCSQCIFRLFNNFNFTSFIEIYQMNQNQFFEIINNFTQSTIKMIEMTSIHHEDQFCIDSLSTLLECWSLICSNLSSNRQMINNDSIRLDLKGSEFLKQQCFEIFKSFVISRISDNHQLNNSINDEDDENEDTDEYLVEEQLTAIGLLGRQLTESSLQLLLLKFNNRFQQLQQLFQQQHQQSLDFLWEDFEWIIEIGGYLLADDNEGELPTVPIEILELTEKYQNSTDNVLFEFINSIFKFSQFEMLLVSKSKLLSPRIAKKLMWFFSRWGQSFLMPEVSHQTESISNSIISMYGSNSENGKKLVDYLLQKISNNLLNWSSEHDVCNETIKLFKVLSLKLSIRKCIIETNTFTELIKNDFNTYQSLQNTSNILKGKLTECLIICTPSYIKRNQEEKDLTILIQVLSAILNPLKEQFNSVLSRNDFQTIYQQPQIIEQIDYCIEKFRGIAKGCSRSQDVSICIFDYYENEQILNNMVKLMKQYHLHETMVTSIIRLFKSCVKSFVSYISKQQCISLFQVTLLMIQTFQQDHSKKLIGNHTFDELREEEQYNDLLMIIQILSFMISKDYLDFSQDDGKIIGQSNNNEHEIILNFVFQGIHLILPLISIELLEFEKLRKEYFKLIGFMVEMYPEKVVLLPNELFNQFINSLSFGMKHFDLEIAQSSFDAIYSLTSYHFKYKDAFNNQDQSFVTALLKQCVQLLLYETFDVELLHNIGETLFGLILWDQNSFKLVIEQTIQSEPNYQQDIANCFQSLMNGITEIDMNRKNLMKFYSNLESNIARLRCYTRRK